MYRFLCFFICIVLLLACDSQEPEKPEEIVDCNVITWQNDILPLMKSSCATSGCHDGITRLDWSNYDLVKKYSATIKSRTKSRNMPVDGSLTQKEIDMIACWVDNGALNN